MSTPSLPSEAEFRRFHERTSARVYGYVRRLALWVDDSFLVIGGSSAVPCPPPVGSGSCDDLDTALRDGAAYHPGTNQWRPIADAPEPIIVGLFGLNPNVRAAAVGRTVYTLSQYWGFLSYNLDTDSWQRLPDAPFTMASSLYAWGDTIVAYPFPRAVSDSGRDPLKLTYEVFQPSTGTWTVHETDQKLPSRASAAVVVGDTLVVSASVDGADGDPHRIDPLWVALVDLPTGAVRLPASQPITSGVLVPSGLPNGLAAWPVRINDGALEPGAADDRAAWVLDPATGDWSQVPFPETVGPLAGGTRRAENPTANRPWPVTTGNLIALRGHLYDPATGRWSRNDELPGARIDVVYVGGDPGVLACWGYPEADAATPAPDCRFLRPATP